MPSTMDSCSVHHRTRAKSRVKSGCRTCKIRKVKCDEGHPSCHRCISTGRVCDGYGIWGGGGNLYGSRQQHTLLESNSCRVASRPGIPLTVLPLDDENGEYFEWFKCRTAIKLPGSFVSKFWSSLLLQASVNEAAVLHAVLALSCVHKRGVATAETQRKSHSIPDEQEQSTLQHYVKAICHLRPHFSIKDGASFRIALITCILFVYLEFLRGHFETAQVYLQNGLNILRDMQILSDRSDGILHIEPNLKSSDQWIVEAFSRLHLQVELFKHAYQHPCLALQVCSPRNPALVFHTINEAWQELEQLLNKVFYLANQGRQQTVPECASLRNPLALLRHQQQIQTDLSRWLNIYTAFAKILPERNFTNEEKAYQLLYVHHTMACIMADTALCLNDESVFDSHTNQFILLIEQLAHLWKISAATSLVQASPKHLIDMSRSIIDIGWIPPLYYTAIKCRVHRIRLQAIRLLESSSHREGIWDANAAACVARKVMEIEERDFYQDLDTADDFPLSSSPDPGDMALQILPDSYRLLEVEFVLSGAPMEKILLFCKQRQEGIYFRDLISEYNVPLQHWIDEKCG